MTPGKYVIVLILIALALALALAIARPRAFGSKEDEEDRRHPRQGRKPEDELIKVRKDDDVGGEGG